HYPLESRLIRQAWRQHDFSGNPFPLLGPCRRCLAGSAKRNRRKIRRYSGGGEVTEHPDTGRQIGGGRFFVNATAVFTRSLGAARFLPLPSPGRLGECPRRSMAAGLSPGRGMAAKRAPSGFRRVTHTLGCRITCRG